MLRKLASAIAMWCHRIMWPGCAYLLLAGITSPANAETELSSREQPCVGASIEISGYSTSDVRLDYQGDFLKLSFAPGDGINMHGFDRQRPYREMNAVFQIGNESLCVRDLVAIGFDLDGGDEAEIIVGTNAPNRIAGKGGNDVIFGGDERDVFRYDVGDGLDCISDRSSDNTIEFGPGISPGQLVVSQVVNGGSSVALIRLLNPRLRVATESGMDILASEHGTASRLNFRFADGNSYSIAELKRLTANATDPKVQVPRMSKCVFNLDLAQRAGLKDSRATNPNITIRKPPSIPDEGAPYSATTGGSGPTKVRKSANRDRGE